MKNATKRNIKKLQDRIVCKEKSISLNINEDDVNRLNSHWKMDAFSKFQKIMLDKNNKFPCIFVVAGVNLQQVRYFFSDSFSDCPDIDGLADALRMYLLEARDYGKNTSLVVFFKPTDDKHSLEVYESHFWEILRRLAFCDIADWPSEIPADPNNFLWEFSFANEPMFVVCNTPAYTLRNSRYSDTFMITFQPRWVFDFLSTPTGRKSAEVIRELLATYDGVSPCPTLGTYGDEENHEWQQYFLPNTNTIPAKKCPFPYKQKIKPFAIDSAILQKGCAVTLNQAIMDLLPEVGSIEVQRDTPGKEHKMHSHSTDETLLIVYGEITFNVGGRQITCTSGDRMLLAADTLHSSFAGNSGCLYVISLEMKPSVTSSAT